MANGANDQKIDGLLDLALSVNVEQREKSVVLGVGYDPEEKTWDLIIKYNGDLQGVHERYPELKIVILRNDYATVTIPEALIYPLSRLPQIDYIEKPKLLFFSVYQGKYASCIASAQNIYGDLKGEGTIIAIIDSGIDYMHPDFINLDGTTRILNLWDQTTSGNPPEGYLIGSEYTSAQINQAIQADNAIARRRLVPSEDTSGHGTAVAGIAAGNGRASGGTYAGVAPQAELIVVKLGIPKKGGFPRTIELMQAINYTVEKGQEYGKPIAINISFGNTYGSHSGDSLLETFINDISSYGKSVFAIGTGNEGYSGGHTSGNMIEGKTEQIELSVGTKEPALNLQIWRYIDSFSLEIIAPNGTSSGILRAVSNTYSIRLGNTNLHIYYGDSSPYSMSEEVFIDFVPRGDYVDTGIWSIRIIPEKVVDGRYDLWLPSANVLNSSTRFLYPTPDITLTIPSTADKVISVGAYDSRYQSYADFSGRGYTRVTKDIKPEIVAPGVNIMTTAVGGNYITMTGTSFATPFVTGAAALLMQWGIVKGNDDYLYGEKVKTYLIRGAKPLSTEGTYPNPRMGYGALCLEDSIP